MKIVTADFLPRSLAIAVLTIVAGAAGFLTRAPGRVSLPADTSPATATEAARGTVQSRTETTVTITGDSGPRTFRLQPATTVEALRPASIDSIRPGEWANAGAVPHAATLYALTGLVVIPSDLLKASR